jgi:hypothetical protein
MFSERQPRPPPREKTFAELFPWRNILRAMMLLLLILAIVAVKRSAGPLLSRVGEMWGPPAPPPADSVRGAGSGAADRRIRLGPGLAPTAAKPAPSHDE